LKLILFICQENSPQREFENSLPEDYILLRRGVDRAGLQAFKEIVAGLVVVDAAEPRMEDWLKKACSFREDLPIIGVAGEKDWVNREVEEMLGFLLFAPFNTWEAGKLLEREWERGQFIFELRELRKASKEGDREAEAPESRGITRDGLLSRGRNEQVLCEFTRALGNSFNRERLLDLFLDTVTKLVPVGRLCILLQGENTGEYHIFSQRGLDPSLCARLCFFQERGLMGWLAEEGRILSRAEAAALARGQAREGRGSEPGSEVAQELKLLQAEISVPLQAHGHLCGSLNVGAKVTGVPFTADELEMLFVLSSNVAIALWDIELHHQVVYQKTYIENILQRMGSGVIAINNGETITTSNSRAVEILSLEDEELIGRDLRWLPSPLGDMLYETMVTGKEYHKQEHQLARGGTFLEFSTNQLVTGEGKVLGSVMVFDDISERKQLEQERLHTDRLDVLNRFVGHLAHEIKNPMVAIQTFTELLPEKYEEDSFREFFNHTVKQEVRRLNDLVEQLIAFSSPLSYRFVIAEAREILDLGMSMLQELGKGEKANVETRYSNGNALLKADRSLLPKALSYLVCSGLEAPGKGGKLFIQTHRDSSCFSGEGLRILLWDSQTRLSADQMETMFDPLYVAPENSISLELPVSKRIIEDHGGQVRITSNQDNCLMFEVLLPMIASEGGEHCEQP